MAKQEITLQGLDGQLDELILTTNDLSEAEQLADRIAVLSHGRLTGGTEKM